MAKKKQKIKETKILQPVSPRVKFDFSGKGDTQIISAMTELEASVGWACMRQHLELQIKIIETQILEKVDIENKKLSDAELDELRAKRNVFLEVIKTPKRLRDQNVKTDPPARSTLDPYHFQIERPLVRTSKNK